MDRDVEREPLARAVLRHLASTRDKDDPLASFARTVLDGEASLRDAAAFSWHSSALAEAAENGFDELNRLSPQQRGEFQQEAVRYRQRLQEADLQGDGDR
jgi:chromosome condensin MukBEF MukE localization factor